MKMLPRFSTAALFLAHCLAGMALVPVAAMALPVVQPLAPHGSDTRTVGAAGGHGSRDARTLPDPGGLLHMIVATAGPGGAISPLGSLAVATGSDQSFEITPASYHHVVDVLVDGASVGAVSSYDFTAVSIDHTIEASFALDTHAITAEAGSGGTIAPAGTVSVEHGAGQTFTITSEPHYHVTDVLVDGVSVGPLTSYTFSDVSSSHAIAASFAIDGYVITAGAGSGGTIDPAGAIPVTHGADQSFTVTPDSGYHVADVQVDGASVGAVTTYTFAGISGAHTIDARFAANAHSLTVLVIGAGTVSRYPHQASYAPGSDVHLTATPEAGSAFSGWSGDAAGTTSPITITMDGDKTVTATFTPLTYVITAAAGPEGAITPSGATSVPLGSSQSFTIEPGLGYHVDDVRVDGVSVGAVTAYTFDNVTAGHTLEASFAINTYAVNVMVSGNGAVTRTPSLERYDHGTSVVLEAVPAPGYRLAGWTGDVDGTTNPVTMVMDADKSIRATFVEIAGPITQAMAPIGGEKLNIGDTFEFRWTATEEPELRKLRGPRGGIGDDGVVTTVDLLISRSGIASDFEPVALGVPNTGSYLWDVTGPPTDDAILKVVAHDEEGNVGVDVTDVPFRIQYRPVPMFISLRADSAGGTGPATSGNGSPWIDVAGHNNAFLWNFTGTPASGWRGDGTPGNPYRLEFAGEEAGINDRVVVPAGSIPELQTIGATTTALWFKTGFDAASPRYEYILEWVQQPTPDMTPEYEGRGMSIIVQNGMLQVYANPWIEVTPVTPNTWYHVAVVKDTNDMRIYVNGERMYAGIKSHRGIQQSDLVLGASTFRVFEGYPFPTYYSDLFTGAVGQMGIAAVAMSDGQVRTLFETDRNLYLPDGLPPPADPHRVVLMRATFADGTVHYPAGTTSPWIDIAGQPTSGTLSGFDGTSTSGWQGDGTSASPYRLEFDGVDDHVTIPPRSIAELQNMSAATTELWVRLGSEILGSEPRYLLEWLQGQGSISGMSIMAADGKLQLFTGAPYWTELAAVTPDTWTQVVVVKQPGEVRAYVNGSRVYTSPRPNIGDQISELVLGASTWRGPGVYGDFMHGAIGSFTVWEGALDDAKVMALYSSDVQYSFGLAGVESQSAAPALLGFRPNPVVGRLKLALTLTSAAPVSIELIDVTGRRVRAREMGSLGAGRHVVDLGNAADIGAGVYFLRLRQDGRMLTAKTTIMR